MSVSTLRVSKQHMIKMATCAIFYCFCCCVNHSSTQFRKVRTLLVIKSTCSVHARAEIMLALELHISRGFNFSSRNEKNGQFLVEKKPRKREKIREKLYPNTSSVRS